MSAANDPVEALKVLRESLALRVMPHTEGDIAVNVSILAGWLSCVDEALKVAPVTAAACELSGIDVLYAAHLCDEQLSVSAPAYRETLQWRAHRLKVLSMALMELRTPSDAVDPQVKPPPDQHKPECKKWVYKPPDQILPGYVWLSPTVACTCGLAALLTETDGPAPQKEQP
jgi:hypothetical protein